MADFVHGQGTGPFADGPVSPQLEVCLKPGTNEAGNVCPVAIVPLAQYEADLIATRIFWEIDES